MQWMSLGIGIAVGIGRILEQLFCKAKQAGPRCFEAMTGLFEAVEANHPIDHRYSVRKTQAIVDEPHRIRQQKMDIPGERPRS
jgi:hypothetical protein